MKTKIPPYMLALFLALFLAGCANGDIPTLLDSDGEADHFADLVVSANTFEERNLRLCFFIAGIVELQTYRITVEGQGDAREVLGNIDSFLGVVAKTKASGGLWNNTEIARVVITLNDIISKMAWERGVRFATEAAALDLRGVLAKAKLVASQSILGAAMIQDVRVQFAMLEAGELTIEQGFESCETRIEQNRQVLRTITGG